MSKKRTQGGARGTGEGNARREAPAPRKPRNAAQRKPKAPAANDTPTARVTASKPPAFRPSPYEQGGEQVKSPIGRPSSLTLDAATLRKLMSAAAIMCTKAEAAAVMDVSESTLKRFLADHPEANEAWISGGASGRASIRRMQWRSASAGSARMQIWLGKQYLGQSDRVDVHTPKPGDTADAHASSLLSRLGLEPGWRPAIDGAAVSDDDTPPKRTH